MKYFLTAYTLLFTLLLSTATLGASAQSLKLSPMVHSAPPGGYSFQALVPLPSMMPDTALNTDNVVDAQRASYVRDNGKAPVTTLELKKKH